MQISPTASNPASTASAANAATATNNTLNYNSFLQLLVSQLKNQDPTNPSEPTAFVSQLASFSAVEQQVNTNSKLDALLTETALSQAGSIIGRTVSSQDGSISGQVTAVQITASGAQAVLANGQTLALGNGVKIS
jgi:flagellar basal-body rod modification protein FlgD